jgi:S-phase kinase-associated protein 1
MPLIKLISLDDKEFEVEKPIAEMSITIKNILEDMSGQEFEKEIIPLPNVNGKILGKIIEYCKYHQENIIVTVENNKDKKPENEIIPWDKEFCSVDQATIFELILAANYLDIKPLLDLTCKTVANLIKGKTVEEIRKTFNIRNDFTPEEEDLVRKENDWCTEG